MALDLDTLDPRDSSPIVRNRQGRTAGPNPFLDKGWLQESFDEGAYEGEKWIGKPKEVGPLTGEEVDTVVGRGATKGQATKKWTGDVFTVMSMLRTAAEKLGIGCAIQVVPALDGRNRELKGKWTVKYSARERTERPRGTANGEVEVESDDE